MTGSKNGKICKSTVTVDFNAGTVQLDASHATHRSGNNRFG